MANVFTVDAAAALALILATGMFACATSGDSMSPAKARGAPTAPAEKPDAAPCDAAVDHMFEIESRDSAADPDHRRRWKEHRTKVLGSACAVRPWSPSYRACIVSAADADALADCTRSEYEGSPLRQRCDSLAQAMSDRILAELERESPAAAAAYRESRVETLPAERIACAVGPWTESELRCVEAARTSGDDQACVGHYRFRRE